MPPTSGATSPASSLAAAGDSRSDSPRSALAATPFKRTPGLLPAVVLRACVNYYFAHLYLTLPIIYPRKVDVILTAIDTSTKTYYSIVSLYALVFLRSIAFLPPALEYLENYNSLSYTKRGKVLLEEGE
jgi:hypothetical protein